MVVSVVRPCLVVLALLAASQPAGAQAGFLVGGGSTQAPALAEASLLGEVSGWQMELAAAGPAGLLSFAAREAGALPDALPPLVEVLAARAPQPGDAAVAAALRGAALPDAERDLAWRLYALLTLPRLSADPLADAVTRGLLLLPLLEMWARELGADPPAPRSHVVDGCDVAEVAPLLCIGDVHDNVHTGTYLLTLDRGGDDLYQTASPTTVATGLPAALLLDIGGNDRHESGAGAQAAGVAGLAVLADLGGRDEYLAGERSQGYGEEGVGLLWDRSGNDTYAAGHSAQGSGLRGIGILLDEAGTDLRSAATDEQERSFAQGYGADDGLGLLVDRLGDDAYAVQRKGQGSGETGGVGVLLDEAGNDRYDAAQEAQGHGQAAGLGLLIEAAGSDVFNATRFAQGFGRAGVGLLVDRSGDDAYLAAVSSQGTGIPGWGLLADCGGDDQYGTGRADGDRWVDATGGGADGECA